MSCQQRKQKRQRSQKRQRKQHGGDASDWVSAVYGPAGSQTAIAGSGNLIAANNLSGVNMCAGGVASNAAPVMVGGAQAVITAPVIKGGEKRKKGGKGLVTDIAVPAVLLYANQIVRSRRTMSKKSKSRKNFSRRYRSRR